MRVLKSFIITMCILMLNVAYGAHQLYADRDGVSIPYGTKLNLKMAQNVTTQNILEGDIINAYLATDIYANNKLILPSNTIFRGRIKEVKYSRMLSRPAKLYITLDHLVTKSGEQLPINAGLASNFNYILKSDGALTTDGNYFKALARDTKKAGQIVKRTVNWGKTSDDTLFTGAKYVFVPISAIGGSLACAGSTIYSAFADLFRHGDEIVIKKGDNFSVILLTTLDVPM